MDWIVGVGDLVVVGFRKSGEEGGPGEGDVVGECEAGFGRESECGTPVIGREDGGAVAVFEDVAKGQDGALEAVVLVEGEGVEEVGGNFAGFVREYEGSR